MVRKAASPNLSPLHQGGNSKDWDESEGPYGDNMVAGPAGIKVSHYRQARAAITALDKFRAAGE